MKLEDIKVGETYNVRVKVKYIDGPNVVAATIGQDGKEGYRTRFLSDDIPAFSPINLYEPLKLEVINHIPETYPFENNEKGCPILDTEEKLQWYVNTLLHCEVDLYEIGAEVNDLETVWLKRRSLPEYLQCLPGPFCDSFFSISDFRTLVHRSAVDVLRSVYARRKAEIQAKSVEEKQYEEFIKAQLKQQADEAEKAMQLIADGIVGSIKENQKGHTDTSKVLVPMPKIDIDTDKSFEAVFALLLIVFLTPLIILLFLSLS